MNVENLKEKILHKKAVIGILGLGYVGLPLLKTFCNQEFSCVGFDVDEVKVTSLKQGKSYIRHIPDQVIKDLIASGRFEPTTDFSKASNVDVLIMCVPTPLSIHRDPDMSYIIATSEAIAPYVHKGQ